MTSGKKITDTQWRHVLQLLRQVRRPGSTVARHQIPTITELHRTTIQGIIEQAAIKWLEVIECAERNDELMDRGR